MKKLLLISGFIVLGLGILGIFLPILPTTPFLLLAAFLFAKSSPKWHQKLITHPKLGTYILNFQQYKAIPLSVKTSSIVLLWITITLSALFATQLCWLKLLLLAIAVGVSIHILSYKTLKGKKVKGKG